MSTAYFLLLSIFTFILAKNLGKSIDIFESHPAETHSKYLIDAYHKILKNEKTGFPQKELNMATVIVSICPEKEG